MKTRLILGAVLVVLAGGFLAASVVQNGAPWGFRDRAAVLVEVVGTAEIYPSKARKQKERIEKASLPGVPGASLYVDDEVRVSAFSVARGKIPGAEVEFLDGAYVQLSKKSWVLKRGLVHVTVDAGQHLKIGSVVGSVSLAEGAYRLAADGNANRFFVYVEDGTAAAETAEGQKGTAEKGGLLMLTQTGVVKRDAKKGLSLSARCKKEGADAVSATRVVTGKADPGTQLFINGKLTYPDDKDTFEARLPPGKSIVVFGRSVSGISKKLDVGCGGR